MAEINFFRQISLFKWAGFLFCFFIFPAFIILVSYDNLLELQLKNQKIQYSHCLSDKLEAFSPYLDQKKYFHFVLQRIFAIASEQQDPQQYLAHAIKRLKENYPGQLEFIVWGERGNLNHRLTDEKRYRYVIRRLYLVLYEVAEMLTQQEFHSFTELELLKSSSHMIRQFLGRVFLPETLAYPYMFDDQASLILVDYAQKRQYFWYQVNDQLGLLCFFSRDVLADNSGLKKIVNVLNRQNDRVKLGFANVSDLTTPYFGDHRAFAHEVIRALGMFEIGAEVPVETANTLVSVHAQNSRVRAFAYVIKDQLTFDLLEQRKKFIAKALVLYFVGCMLIFIWLKYRQAFISIRWKLVALILYANFAPLVILGFIAYDYLQNRRLDIYNEFQLNASRFINGFDQRFTQFTEEISTRFKDKVDQFNIEVTDQLLSQAQIDDLVERMHELDYDEIYLVDTNKQALVSKDSQGNPVKLRSAYNVNLADALMTYYNRIIIKTDKTDLLNRLYSPEESEVLRRSLVKIPDILSMQIGEATRLNSCYFIGRPNEYINNYAVLLTWSQESFEKLFMAKLFDQLEMGAGTMQFFAYNKGLRLIFPLNKNELKSDELFEFMQTASKRNLHVSPRLRHEGSDYIAIGINGQNMKKTTMVALYPVANIESELALLRNYMIAGGLLSLLITVGIAMALSAQFLNPIQQLEAAAIQIRKGNFRHRINTSDSDEFGHLSQVLNRVTEGLGELEIAKVVQDSLFPDERMSVPPFEVFGRSVAMSTLGGDYYDFLEVDSDHFGVIMGDVSGHGVAAGLIMAMAKAGVKTAAEADLLQPDRLISLLHPIIYSLKSKKIKRMMTLQYLVFAKNSDLVKLSNAGHCYPLLIDQHSRSSRFVEQFGTPLGITRAIKSNLHEFTVKPGESLVLYTDGIVESCNESGEPLGFDRFQSMVMKCCDTDPQVFYERIYEAYLAWAGTADDDTTLIIIHKESKV